MADGNVHIWCGENEFNGESDGVYGSMTDGVDIDGETVVIAQVRAAADLVSAVDSLLIDAREVYQKRAAAMDAALACK